jgi:hypothetical protein
MPVEIVGEFGTSGTSRESISAQGDLAIRHLITTCGTPPPEMELQVQWQEHELGSYPLLVLTWEDSTRGAPARYLSKCQEALFEFDTGERLPQYPSWWDDADLEESRREEDVHE